MKRFRFIFVAFLLVALSAMYHQTAYATVLNTYNFNGAGDLASNFNNDAGEAYTETSNGGIAGSRAVSVDTVEGIYAAKTGYSELTTGQTLTVSGYFLNNGSSGYGSLGFVDASPSNGTTGIPTAHNLSVRFHGGGGDLYHNGTEAANFSFPGGDLENGVWYRVIFSITKEENANSYASNVQFWKTDTNGNLLTQVFDASVQGFVNADLAGKTLYPFFGTGQSDRIVTVDNIEVTDAAFVGTPGLSGAGTANDPWQLTECYTITDSGYYKLMNDIDSDVGTCISVEADDVHIDGNSYGITGDGLNAEYGISALTHANIEIKNITLEDFLESAISLANITGVSSITNSTFSNIQQHAISGEGVRNLTITGNTISETHRDAIQINPLMMDVTIANSGITISNNTISNISGNDGIQVEYTDTATISNNTITSTGDDGIYVSSSNNVTITGNTVDHTADDGIDIERGEGGGDTYTITSNTLSDIGDNGMELSELSHATITDNIIHAYTSGIKMDSGSTNNSIARNILSLANTNGFVIPSTTYAFEPTDIGLATNAIDGETYTDFGNYKLLGDDQSFQYDLPFTFNYQGRNITRISVSTNGLVELLETGEKCGGGDSTIEEKYFNCDFYGSYRGAMYGDVLFANFDDLYTDTTPNDYVAVFNKDAHTVVIEWFGTTFTDHSDDNYTSVDHPIHFQVVLHDNGHVDWNMDKLEYSKYRSSLFTGAYDAVAQKLYIAGMGLHTNNTSFSADLSGAGSFITTTVSPKFTGVILDDSPNNSITENTITATVWVDNTSTSNTFNTSKTGNTYYFANGLGAWTTYNILDTNNNGYAEAGRDRPFNHAKLGDLWVGEGQDAYPGTLVKKASTSVGGYASASYLASHGVTIKNNPASVQPSVPTVPKKDLCPADQILTQNLKAPSQNGKYNSYTGGIVKEAKILQAHLNRLGFNAGPVDGFLGPLSDGAIKRMQASLGTMTDGYVGPITRGLLNNSCTTKTP